jgi:hypothetical protein
MRRLSNIFLVLGAVFLALRLMAWAMPSMKYELWSIFRKDISLYYHGDLGNVYKIGTRYAPSDSIVEYYWDGKYIWKGHIELYQRDLSQVREAFINADNIKSEKMTVITVGPDSIYYFSYKPDDQDNQAAELCKFDTHDEIHFYGNQLLPDNAIKAGIIILYGSLKEFKKI